MSSIEVKVDTRVLEQAIEKAPAVAYFWLRNWIFGAFVKHRLTWLQSKGTKFGRGGGEGSKAIRVARVGDPAPGPNDVGYAIDPAEPRVTPDAGAAALNALRAEIQTGSVPLRVHQFGEDIRTQRWMAIAFRTRPAKLRRWREKYPQRKLVTLPSPKNPQTLLMYEKQQVRGRGRPRKDGSAPAVKREKLVLRFVLRRFVEMDPTLKLYETWDSLQAERDARFATAASRIVKDIASGKSA